MRFFENDMRPAVTAISSMATKAVLEELTRGYRERTGITVALQSAGGVDVALRVEAGAVFDAVILAREAIDRLTTGGHLLAGSARDLVRSAVGVAVQAGAPRPDISDEEAVKRAVLEARTIGFSTGPSGVALAKQFQRWGIADDALRGRTVTPPPGVPVAALIARGEVALGFQQLSELRGVAGVDVLGPLPRALEIVTLFSGAIGAHAPGQAAAQAWLDFLGSADTAAVKERYGMETP